MVVETPVVPFSEWIGPALFTFLAAALIMGTLGVLVGLLMAMFRYGPGGFAVAVARSMMNTWADVISNSPRRIAALAWLAIRESIRGWVLIGLALFGVILLFGNWFISGRNTDPAALYMSFVMTTTSYLILVMAWLNSVFSLPNDIKSHTIYTIVTKPVRPGEIVLGRIIGFSLVGAAQLAVMGLISYVFVVRSFNHTHDVDVATLASVGRDSVLRTGDTTTVQGHKHRVTMDAEGFGTTDVQQGHWHDVTAREDKGRTVYEFSPPQDLLTARVPLYGKLKFLDRDGNASDKGISVGKEWKYHSYIAGGTPAAAIWTFEGVTPERFPTIDGQVNLPIEMSIRVFRTHKGIIERGILGNLELVNPRTGRASEISFRAKEFEIDRKLIPRKMIDKAGQPIDLFDDLVADGKLQIKLQCIDPEQYFGIAQADIYLRAGDASFAMNFAKSYLAIGIQMVIVICFGVMFSTLLSGPVGMLATFVTLMLGYFRQFIEEVATGKLPGGGPIESFIHAIQQDNTMAQLPPGTTTDIIHGGDTALMFIMRRLAGMIPNLGDFSDVEYVAQGFNIPWDLLAEQALTGLAFVAATAAIGYFFLRSREVAL